jgi:hypothetical protein
VDINEIFHTAIERGSSSIELVRVGRVQVCSIRSRAHVDGEIRRHPVGDGGARDVDGEPLPSREPPVTWSSA